MAFDPIFMNSYYIRPTNLGTCTSKFLKVSLIFKVLWTNWKYIYILFKSVLMSIYWTKQKWE